VLRDRPVINGNHLDRMRGGVSGQALYPRVCSRSTRYIEPFLAAPMIRFTLRCGADRIGQQERGTRAEVPCLRWRALLIGKA